MAASSIFFVDFTGTKRYIATDLTAGVHTLQVTTSPPNSTLAFEQPNGFIVKMGTVLTDGIHTLCVTPAA